MSTGFWWSGGGIICVLQIHLIFMLPRRKFEGYINLPLFVRSSVRILIHGLSGYLPLQFRSYNFNILKDVYTHIMYYAWSQEFDFHQIFSKWQVVELSHFVRPSGYRYMVCPAISSYRIGATALIFCMIFMHIMEVDLFIISYGQVGGIMCVLQTHFIFRKITPSKNNFVHNYQVQGHTSFLVFLK